MACVLALTSAVLMAISGTLGSAAVGEAKGTLTYQAKSGPITVAVKHAYIFKGPDVVSGQVIRRLILTSQDIGAKLRACQDMSCSTDLDEGLTVDFGGKRLMFWFVANNQRVQYSGTADTADAKLTTDSPERLAGRLNIDSRGAGGPMIQVEFDAAVVKEVKK